MEPKYLDLTSAVRLVRSLSDDERETLAQTLRTLPTNAQLQRRQQEKERQRQESRRGVR